MTTPRSRPLATGRPVALSVTDLFTIGVGPSSSHTVGPMRAALRFANEVLAEGQPVRIRCDLFGSLALTGRGHATDTAILLGLSGWAPEMVDPDTVAGILDTIRSTGRLMLSRRYGIAFIEQQDLIFQMGEFLPQHANAVRFTAELSGGREFVRTFFSVGGGAIVQEGCKPDQGNETVPFPFSSGVELLRMCAERACSVADLVWANEEVWRPQSETEAFVDAVRSAMFACMDRGCRTEGVLPGGLKVQRRAKPLHDALLRRGPRSDPSTIFEWVSLYALAVNEENAAGGRVVTAPTNGAAGVLPAVLKFYETFTSAPTLAGARKLLMTAAAIGFLYKARASISAAEMGCQGEVGVACSMAAAGLAAALGGSNEQVENAAEIGMEHNLGLTCDPIGGLVQIPCIERNTMGAVKAINAAYLALNGDGTHFVSLDAVIETMRQTGEDMRSKYKETSLGGLAVNVVEC